MIAVCAVLDCASPNQGGRIACWRDLGDAGRGWTVANAVRSLGLHVADKLLHRDGADRADLELEWAVCLVGQQYSEVLDAARVELCLLVLHVPEARQQEVGKWKLHRLHARWVGRKEIRVAMRNEMMS